MGDGSEIITKGDQVKIPSETLLDFTLQQSVTIPKQQFDQVLLGMRTKSQII